MSRMFRSKIGGKGTTLMISAVIALLAVTDAAGAECSNEIYVRFNQGVINLPNDKAWHTCDSISIRSEDVLTAMLSAGGVSLQKRFYDTDLEQVTVTNPAGIEIVRPTFFGIYKLGCNDSLTAGTLARDLTELDDVVYAFQNGTRSPDTVIPNDDRFHNQWSLKNTGQAYGMPGDDIKVTYAWEVDTGSVNILIGMLDQGVQTDHPDLTGRVIGDATYTGSHGTGVAGIIGASTNNWIGVAGINWASPILSKDISGFDYEVIHDKLIAAVDQGADMINHSWGGYTDVAVEHKAFAYAYNMDVLSIAAAGNDRTDQPHFPAAFSKVMCVSATTNNDLFAEDYCNFGSTIDVAAPGGQNDPIQARILSCVPQSYGYEYAYYYKTSFAAPHVTGLASLLKSHNPDLWNDDISSVIELSADDLGNPGWDQYYGWGRINARRAFEILDTPNLLVQNVASNGYTYDVTDSYSQVFFGIPDLADGAYIVKRYEVRNTVSFPAPWYSFKGVWDRGSASRGYAPDNPNYGRLFSGVVGGSVTETGFTITTFVYDVWTLGASHVGWVPCSPSQAFMAYSTLGEYELQPVVYFTAGNDYYYPHINLSWGDYSLNEEGFVLERKDATSGVWQSVDTLPPAEYWTSYEDWQIVGSETYTYRVKPFTRNQTEFEWSDEIQIKSRPMPPENIECYVFPGRMNPPQPSNKIEVSWSPPQNQLLPLDHYVVWRQVPDQYMGERFGPIHDTSIVICPNPKLEMRNFWVYCFDSEGDSSVVLNYCGANFGQEDWCPDTPSKIASTAEGESMLPGAFRLDQNTPNPFNPTTEISFSLPFPAHTELSIYNLLGQKVQTLVDDNLSAGRYTFHWNGRNQFQMPVSSGIYIYRLIAGDKSDTKKMLLLK